eukprot:gene3457-2554_t
MSTDEDIPVRVGIVGAGLTGTMLAAFLDRIPGIQIILFERSMDLATDLSSNAFGNAPSAIKRSINMALSLRGIKALDELALTPEVLKDFQNNPVGSLVQIRADPWKIKRFLIIGDAAHAVVPFYGQGMNSAFEDALQFYLLLRDRFRSVFTLQQRIKAFDDTCKIFYLGRKPAIDVLSDISENQFRDMSHNTNSWWYLLHHRLRHWLMPASLKTMYRFVAFSNEPYHKALKLAKRNDLIFKGVLFTTVSAIGLFGYQAFIHFFNKKK